MALFSISNPNLGGEAYVVADTLEEAEALGRRVIDDPPAWAEGFPPEGTKSSENEVVPSVEDEESILFLGQMGLVSVISDEMWDEYEEDEESAS